MRRTLAESIQQFVHAAWCAVRLAARTPERWRSCRHGAHTLHEKSHPEPARISVPRTETWQLEEVATAISNAALGRHRCGEASFSDQTDMSWTIVPAGLAVRIGEHRD